MSMSSFGDSGEHASFIILHFVSKSRETIALVVKSPHGIWAALPNL